MSPDARRRAGSAGIVATIAVAAAAWFASTMGAGGELNDTGMILYPAWLVALGRVPYRDFPHVYGPSLFLLNGVLFRTFGLDLLVVRVALVALKTLTVVLVYVVSARVASRATSAAAAAVTAAAWGAPWWIGVTPYAIYYQLPLTLAAAVLVARPDPPGARRALAAGALVGVAATFKHTGGLFGFFATALFVLVATADGGGADGGRRGGRLLRAGGILAAVAVCVGYVATYGFGATQAILLAPMACAGGVLARREATRADTARSWQGIASAAWLAAGAATPFLAYAALYAAVGGGRAALADTVLDLPQRIRWYEPLVTPEPTSALVVAIVILAAAVAGARRTRWLAAIAGGAVLLALVRPESGPWLVAYVARRGWYPDVLQGLVWVLIALSCIGLWIARRDPSPLPWLVVLLAATTLLQLHPAADIPHAVLVAPGVAPVGAYVVDRLRAGRGRTAAFAAAAAILAAPFVDAVVRYRIAPPPRAAAPHATGIGFDTPELIDAAAVATRLAAPDAPPGPIFVWSSDSLLYLLAGRPSVFEREEFVLYLRAIDIVTADDARALVDEDAMVARLRAARPLVVDRAGSVASQRLRATFPRLAAAIDADYGPIARVGSYRVLAPMRR